MNRIQCVNVSNQKSSALDTLTGVPQGSILGPLLFSLYINDLPSVCSDVEIQLYADDAVIFTHGSNKLQAAATLTNALNRISTWLIQSCLQLNTSKTVCMFFSKKQCSTPDPAIMLSGVKLQVVSEFKYLRPPNRLSTVIQISCKKKLVTGLSLTYRIFALLEIQ